MNVNISIENIFTIVAFAITWGSYYNQTTQHKEKIQDISKEIEAMRHEFVSQALFNNTIESLKESQQRLEKDLKEIERDIKEVLKLLQNN